MSTEMSGDGKGPTIVFTALIVAIAATKCVQAVAGYSEFSECIEHYAPKECRK